MESEGMVGETKLIGEVKVVLEVDGGKQGTVEAGG